MAFTSTIFAGSALTEGYWGIFSSAEDKAIKLGCSSIFNEEPKASVSGQRLHSESTRTTWPLLGVRGGVERGRRRRELRNANVKTGIGKLPVELRRQILKYLMPTKQTYRPVGKWKKDIPPQDLRPNQTTQITTNNPALSETVLSQRLDHRSDYFELVSEPLIPTSTELDPYPRSMAIPLMLTDSVVFCEVAQNIMYEEQIFHVHVHDDGIDFLHLPRIPIVETVEGPTGEPLAMEENLGCITRMKHLTLVIFGPKTTTEGRDKAYRMFVNLIKLAELLEGTESPLYSLTIVFLAEETKEGYVTESGDFWEERRPESSQARASPLHEMSNVEFMTSPFAQLRDIAKVELHLPTGLRMNMDLLEFKERIEHRLSGTQKRCNSCVTRRSSLSDAFDDYRHQMCCRQLVADMTNREGPRADDDGEKDVREEVDIDWWLTEEDMATSEAGDLDAFDEDDDDQEDIAEN